MHLFRVPAWCCSAVMISPAAQRSNVQILLVMDYFEIFNAILKKKNSKAPGDMSQGPKGGVVV